ncbi:MAG: hypothetical protein FWB74_08845 [Defluviitaleaceae bacterium]|nr:hypothetical protein [Defluviitaleaceae bacterium]
MYQRQSPKNQDKTPLRENKTHLFFGITFAIILLYLVGHYMTAVLDENVEQVRIELAYLEPPASFYGVIVRDEAVYFASSGANLIFHVENLTRVRAGHVVASPSAGGAAGLLDFSEAQGDATAHNYALRHTIENADLSTLSDLQALGLSTAHAMAERNFELAASLAPAATGGSISALAAGIVSYHIDGFENIFTPENMNDISNFNPTGSSNSGAFRVVRSNDWYIVAAIPSHYAAPLLARAHTTIYVSQPSGLLPLNVAVYRMTDSGNGYFHTIFMTNFETLRFIDQRNVTFQLSPNPGQGLLIPRTAIVERSIFPVPRNFVAADRETITVQTAEGTAFAVAGWLSNDGNYFYILADGSNLRTHDTLIFEDEYFEIGLIKTVQGVFVSNRGHSLFRQIFLPENFYFGLDYVVLEPAENPHIQLFDWIIHDAGSVDNRDLLN